MFRVWGFGFGIWGLEIRVQGLGFWVLGLDVRAEAAVDDRDVLARVLSEDGECVR